MRCRKANEILPRETDMIMHSPSIAADRAWTRRSFLGLGVGFATAGAFGLAGCSGGSRSLAPPSPNTASTSPSPAPSNTPTATPTPPPLRGKIAFHRPVGQEFQIFTINADGSGETQLTKGPGSNYLAKWSRDGTKIAFIGDRPGAQSKVWVMNADGSGSHRVTSGTNKENVPVWHPDGTSLMYVEVEVSGWNLFTVALDGTERRRLTTFGGVTTQPSYSPDGKKIAFAQGTDDKVAKVWVMNPDGSDAVRLSGEGDNDWQPVWSPDGSRIAFNHLSGPGLFTMRTDGTDRRFLIGDGDWPVWAPDGNYVLFQRFPDGVFRLFAVPFAGGDVRTIVSNYAGYPSWGPGTS
jgi:TolB protein